MSFFLRIVAICLLAAGLSKSAGAQESRDVAVFVKAVFHDQIEGVKRGIYCRALDCDFEIQSFLVTETTPQTYALYSVGWLEGTIPGLKGSARRTLHLTASYARGTCIVKEITAISDETTNNNGWGASKIEKVFKTIEIPPFVILTPQDCRKVEDFLANPPPT